MIKRLDPFRNKSCESRNDRFQESIFGRYNVTYTTTVRFLFISRIISFKSHWIYSRVRRQVRCNRSCLRFVFWEGFIKTRSMVLQWLISQERVMFCFQACKISCLVQAMTSNCGCVIYELKYNNMSVCYMENTKIGMRYLLGSMHCLLQRRDFVII